MTTPPGWRLEPVEDVEDPRLRAYRGMTDVEMRREWEPRSGIFMAEGLLVIERVAAAGLAIESVLTAPKWISRLAAILGEWSGPIYLAEPEQLRHLTGYNVHRGALACVRRPAPLTLAEVVARPGDVIVLGDLVDHTNVGLAVRSAAALGVAGAVLSPACADPLYRRAVKSSMGAVLSLPWARSEEWPQDLNSLGGRTQLALTPRSDAEPLDRVLSTLGAEDVALVVGPEGPGLSETELGACDRAVRIPMDAGIDSLNVAAAVAVACYALRMRRTP